MHQSIIEGPTYGLYYVQDNPPGYWPVELYGISGAGRLQVRCKSEEAEKKNNKNIPPSCSGSIQHSSHIYLIAGTALNLLRARDWGFVHFLSSSS